MEARGIYGAVDAAALEAAINCVVARHEALRTAFRVVGVEPAQIVLAQRPVRLAIEDVDLGDGESPEPAVNAIAQREVSRAFDLAHDPLLRVQLLRLGATRSVLLVMLHHIVGDEWSIDIFERELAAAYDAISTGKTPSLGPELSVQVADVAAEERRRFDQSVEERLFAFWRDTLSGVETAPADGSDTLVTGRPAPRGVRQHHIVPDAARDAALRLTRSERTTLFVILLTAFGLVLWNHIGRRRFVVGSPISMRTRETEAVIGCFLNTLPLVLDVTPETSGRELLARNRHVVLDAMTHAQMPFERLTRRVAALRPERGRALRFWLALLNTPHSNSAPGSLRWEPLSVDPGICQFDLALIVRQRQSMLDGFIEYDAARYSGGVASALVAAVHACIVRLADEPDAPAEQIVRPEHELRADRGAPPDARPDFAF